MSLAHIDLSEQQAASDKESDNRQDGSTARSRTSHHDGKDRRAEDPGKLLADGKEGQELRRPAAENHVGEQRAAECLAPPLDHADEEGKEIEVQSRLAEERDREEQPPEGDAEKRQLGRGIGKAKESRVLDPGQVDSEQQSAAEIA